MKHVLGTSPALADRNPVAYRITYDLLAPVKVLRKELGLTPNCIGVLTALISFLPRDKTEKVETPALTIVFPSNEALSERCNGIDERTIRRCLVRLVEAGLITRRTSANRKRFPLRFGGTIRDAFGFDLQPLAVQRDALANRARSVAQTHQDLMSLRATALSLRVAASHLPDLSADEAVSISAARNTLRRTSLTTDEALAIVTMLQTLLRKHSNSATNETRCNETLEPALKAINPQEMSGGNGQNVRQIESQKKEFKIQTQTQTEAPIHIAREVSEATMNVDPATMAWTDFVHVASFFPEEPQSATSLTRTIFDLGRLLRIGQQTLARMINISGPGRILLAFNYLLSKADSIRNPEAYFERMLRGPSLTVRS